MKLKFVNQEMLKLIACVTMLMDHLGAVFFWPRHWWLRVVGRLAFPIFCFLLAEGICHTKNPKKYALRLLVGAVLAELPFDLLFFGRLTWAHQSVMVTLLLAFLYGMAQKKLDGAGLKLLAVVPFMVLADLLHTDYGSWGVAMVALFLLTREKRSSIVYQLLGMIMINHMIGGVNVPIGFLMVPIQMLALGALVPIGLYSGEKATKNVWVQRAFYLFYPVHLALLLIGSRI